MKNQKILVGLSGGVDSAVTAHLLKKQGYDVTAGFMINYLAPEGENCPTSEDIEEAKKVAKFLDIPFFTFDYRDEYEQKVLGYLYEGYKKGITPNPDIMCNSEIKFRVFLDEALSHGFDCVATGHYARIEEINGKFHLKKGIDNKKDQSYFLAGLKQDQLSKAMFPIGELDKTEVRKIALEAGLPNAMRKDSQGICFVGKVDLSKFLEKKIDHKIGDIVDTKGNKLGEHKGVYFYTIGQRKGLDLGGLKEPVFVIKKDIVNNQLIVGTDNDASLYNDKLTMSNINYLCTKKFSFPLKANAKIRYRQADQEVVVEKVTDDKLFVRFLADQRAIASGQICAIYIGEELVISGVID